MITYSVPTTPAVFPAAVWRTVGRELARLLRYRRPRSVGLAWVTLAEMRRHNRQYRQKDRPTDVLSFETVAPEDKNEGYLGDILVCPPHAQAEARRRGIHPHEELLRLVIHGTLHLSGLDHATPAEEAHMFALQERCLTRVAALCKFPF